MQKKNRLIDYILIAFLFALCIGGFIVSLFTIFIIPYFTSDYSLLKEYDSLKKIDGFIIAPTDPQADIIYAYDSPVAVEIKIKKPIIEKEHLVKLIISKDGKIVKEINCYADELSNAKEVLCNATFPYTYTTTSKMELMALLEDVDGKRITSNKLSFYYDWTNYEKNFRSISSALFLTIILGFLLLVVPIAAYMYHLATLEKHHIIYKGEYTLKSLIEPFKNVKTKEQFFQAFISSPLFWLAELVSGAFLITYYALSTEAFKTDTSFVAFLVSGGFAFFVPFLWVAIWWLADYKEREPLRIIISLFLWGVFCCIVAIGLNTIFDAFFILLGLGLISAMIFPPLIEEFFKGSGLAIFSFHHDYTGIGDGLVYGFTIGMGFAFMENWLYLINNPIGADVWGWAALFFFRSVIFSAMHGVYTAITGAFIGYLKMTNMPQIILFGFAIIPAVLLHAIHNSIELLTHLFGGVGVLAYCCIIAPIFDYGGLFAIALIMLVWLRFSKKK